LSKENLFQHAGLSHGGNVLAMAEKYNIPEEQWLDLSTGLNPNGWPVPAIPEHVWQALPQEEDELQEAASQYYGCDYCLPVAGSQAAIETLPTLRNLSNVGIVSPSYAEHEYAWRKSGHNVKRIDIKYVEDEIEHLDVLVIINPNNPSGHRVSVETLLFWHQQLVKKGGWLIVDEAFMDVTPELSLIKAGIRPGLIILRSLGKFFGLAGVRCGFVITERKLLALLAEKIGPWSVTGPSRYVAIKALKDKVWQTEMRTSLKFNSEKLSNLLNEYGFFVNGGSALFQWFKHQKAEELFVLFAKQGILVRLFNERSTGTESLRLGLPKDESQWNSLTEALSSISDSIKRKETKEALTNA
jgi:cobalamin biosynthetic protein CobC